MSPALGRPLSERLTIAITTKDRWPDLIETLNRLRELGIHEWPMIVIDDGSKVVAPEAVLLSLKKHRLIRFEESEGLVAQRNRLAQLTMTDYMLSIDDDSAPITAEGFMAVIDRMDSDPMIGVVGLPIVLNSGLRPQCDRKDWSESSTFIGCGHVLRVSMFNALGGYWGHLVYWGEERDYSLRLMTAGYKVVDSPDPIIFHRVSSFGRSSTRFCYFRARNTLLIWHHHVPYILLPFVIARAALGILYSNRRERDLFVASGRGIVDAFRAIIRKQTREGSYPRMSLEKWFRWRKLSEKHCSG